MPDHRIREDIFNILRVLSTNTDLTQRDISGYLGISLGKTNYLLKALAKKGLIKIKNFARRKEKLTRVKYILTPKGLEEKLRLTRFFLERKEKEYLELKKEWERTLHAIR
ncbi:MAG TPA: MarR family EPS-associated transcriptional regulator [candidate division WOR-3 bacterium]|uniref:MarR family EPS-associated transcriptional regulator n=1 Tax=candidate division WOR-3 bacterium TaxID=2052148 RepID=A0A7C5H679_UNCW3|nr:MarR family EPS-associated transcriptional regulator [candidate division WOR-3 bacterium]